MIELHEILKKAIHAAILNKVMVTMRSVMIPLPNGVTYDC